ncbi:hypothetical protein MGG_16821 [Pyricularia oryzae 70-15]|uniref:Uncharacterized protein n=3 Tax=Pyricularia oryzae TaxID=318829 RepID=G4N2R6_PYRO7|nr:uncharacterized protein MGG_16821 [Pyricularia oryzae 70-15]EHA52571.1 hypothetical protein MGG_16821 [Pyricularia oryzae 70-15]ELQ34785.1 hypothetical protein OOU_Y34scaffold00745g60 [Pyricularia oryzae Y34]
MASDFATAGVNPAAGDGAVGEENEENILRAHYLRGLEVVKAGLARWYNATGSNYLVWF